MTDEEFDGRVKALEIVDGYVQEALSAVTALKGVAFSPDQAGMLEAILGDMFDIWHDRILDEWAKELK